MTDPRAAQQAAYIDWMRRETDRNGTVAAKQGPIAICDAKASETPLAGSASDRGASQHWFGRLAETSGVEAELVVVNPGEKRRVVPTRKNATANTEVIEVKG